MNRSDESCFYTVFSERDPEEALLICEKKRYNEGMRAGAMAVLSRMLSTGL